MKIKEYKEQYPGLYYFDTFTFTTLGTSGSRGPDASKSYANAPWREGDFSIQDGQQHWTVPANGTYQITAAGAYGAAPGRVVSGQVELSKGQTVKLLVGQCPSQLTANVQDNVTVGGGGGTFVVTDKPLIVASGGDGGSFSNVYSLESTLNFANYVTSTLSSDGTTTAIASGSSIQIYRGYTLQTTFGVTAADSNNGFYKSIDLSSDGNALSVCTSDGKLLMYKFVNGAWTSTQIGTLTNAVGTSINSDGTVVMFMTSTGDAYAYVYSDGTWTSTYINSLYSGKVSSIALSGNGNVGILVKFDPFSYVGVYSVTRSGTSWSLQGVFPSVFSIYPGGPMCSVNYDGTIAAVLNTYNGQVQICNYSAGSWSNTLVTTTTNGYSRGLALNSSGDTLAFVLGSSYFSSSNIGLYKYSGGTWSLAYTIVNTTGDISFGSATSINSLTNKIVTRGQYNVYTITYPLSQPGTFSPSGTGAGYSGAGYLTDGQCTDPYFGFLTPKAYTNGGFGNAYEYGVIAEQGGFGGGQSPIGLRTALTSIKGSSNVYPNLNGQLVCMSLDGTIALVANIYGATVYRYSSGWDAGTSVFSGFGIYPYYYSKQIAISEDGNTILLNGRVRTYSGGSWSSATVLESSSTTGSLNSDGTKAFLCTASSPGNAKVYTYSGGSWGSGTELPWAVQPQFIRISSMSSNGTTAAYIEHELGVLSIFRYSGGSWSLSNTRTITTQTEFSLGTSANGNTVLVGRQPYVDVMKYSGGAWSTQTLSNTSVNYFGQAVSVSPDGVYYYIGSETSLFVYKNDVFYTKINLTTLGDLASSSSIFAYSTSKYPGASSQVIFANVYQLSSVCTANTIVAHGYPHTYKVTITGTSLFNGTWDITTTSSNTFTFQAFSGLSGETSGYVSGTVTGVSGGGGYTGSLGDGVTSATCYADESVTGFTDLGASSNTSGYITVSLVDPKPLTETWSWTDRTNWQLSGIQLKNCQALTWNGQFIGINTGILPSVQTSPDGITWSYVNSNLSLMSNAYQLTTQGSTTLLVNETGLWTSTDTVTWLNKITTPSGLLVSAMSNVYYFTPATGTVYISADNGLSWTNQTSASLPSTLSYIAYGNGLFVGTFNSNPSVVVSSEGLTWTYVYQTTGINTSASFVYGNGLFITSGSGNVSYSSVTPKSTITSNLYVIVGSGPSSVGTSLDTTTWIPRSSISDVSTWNSVTYGNGLFVAVGYYCGMYSSDGITWSTLDIPIAPWISVTYGNNLFVAVGYSAAATSTNGTTWTSRTVTSNTYISVTYGASLYVAVGTNCVMASPNGTTWTPYAITNYTWKSVTYGNGKFLAVSDGQHIATSTDGFTWSTVTIPHQGNLQSVCYGNGLFVSAGFNSSNIITSTTGTTWSNVAIPAGGGYFSSAIYAGNQFIVSSLYSTDLLTSPDGVTWTKTLTGLPLTSFATSVTYAPDKQINTSSSWSQVTLGDTLTQINSNGTRLLGIGTANVWTSSNGTQWSQAKNSLAGISFQSTIAPGPDYYVLTDGKYTYVSIDGQYVVHPIANSGGFYQTVYSAQLNLFVSSGSGIVSVSSDAQNWTTVTLALLSYPNAIEWSPTLGIFVIYCLGQIFISYDGYNWTNYTGPNVPVANGDRALIWSDSLGIFMLGGYATSRDGINWTQQTNFTSKSNVFVAVGTTTAISSIDGFSWRRNYTSSTSWSKVAASSNLFVAVSSSGPSNVMTSYDGTNWSVRTAPFATSAVAYGNGVFLAVGTNCAMVSVNGITWTSNTVPNGQWCSIAYGNGTFVAVANLPYYSGLANYIMTTTNNGVSWSVHNVGIQPFIDVTYGNGKFVAVSYFSDASGDIITSSDGLTWARTSQVVQASFSSITYGNGKFVALCTYGNQGCYTSPDAVTWTSISLPSYSPNPALTSITYGNGLFIGVGYGTIAATNYPVTLTSSDGTTWSWNAINDIVTSVCTGNITSIGTPFAWSPSLKIFTNGNYYSLDGQTWTSSGTTFQATSITWSSSLGIFACVDSTKCYTSQDGKTWTTRTPGWSLNSPVITWSPETGIFLVSGTQGSTTYIYTSTDGISFTNEGTFQGLNQSLTCATQSSNTFILSDGSAFFVSQPFQQSF